jgi:hypothetical protein
MDSLDHAWTTFKKPLAESRFLIMVAGRDITYQVNCYQYLKKIKSEIETGIMIN